VGAEIDPKGVTAKGVERKRITKVKYDENVHDKYKASKKR